MSANNPFYTCPTNTYAKVIIKFYNASGNLWYGIAPGVPSDGSGHFGTMIDFVDPTYTTHFVGNGSYEAGVVIYLMPGEKLCRDARGYDNSYYIWFQVIEYAIP